MPDPSDSRPIRRALISVSDKRGVAEFAAALTGFGAEVISTGGTAQMLRDAGIPVSDVSEMTGFAEILSGRVKTLHPAVHAGLLATNDPAHQKALAAAGIKNIDLLAVTLYPFEEQPDIETIDIGGPAMIRAAAKNHDRVAVITDPDDYPAVLDEMAALNGATSESLRRALATRAFQRTAAYDSMIAAWLENTGPNPAPDPSDSPAPFRALGGPRRQALRYGENPHQQAAFYLSGDGRSGVGTARQLQGKAISYNNILDADAAFELAAAFDPAESAVAVIVKHMNPCGVACAPTLAEAFIKARAADAESAFGGVVAFNRELDGATAAQIRTLFTEVVIAPGVAADAEKVLAGSESLRVLTTGSLPGEAGMMFRSVAGGFLAQSRDTVLVSRESLHVVTQQAPEESDYSDMLLAWRVCRHVASNAIVYVRDRATVGIGGGQPSRVGAVRLAAGQAESMSGAVVASDGFFPFPDAIELIAQSGARGIIQPGGSKRDAEVIAAADACGLAMVFTGVRHFRH